ncbi:MAG: hypothetical protein EZS26_003232 [Candidatus Ordinivivax streblomastigis]|uniref:Uncharacterized protein n=1 Tax=Candidatus Ordinivivax streblomastigis TaxID=2540710 RepID=A0A5M8NUP6_9BACT|nr:MAG: hypothetical protein EZS26_003232 [Candidatus Ordinivivax streblomastigis]
MQRNVIYPSSVSLVIRGLHEFGMIFAERDYPSPARNLLTNFRNFYTAVTCFLHDAALFVSVPKGSGFLCSIKT